MPTLTITFPGKRYHATPWGAHVNEGQVEWPPSPWRLCRALLATGFAKLGWAEDDLPPAAVELVTALCGALPVYRLPEAVTAAHSRHYMPIAGTTTKVFDGFARLGEGARGEIKVGWDVDLSPAAFMLLAELAEQLGYLGRAESWAVGAVTPGRLQGANCRPCLAPELMEDAEPVTLLAPMTAADYLTWREGQVQARPELAVAGKGRRGRGRAAAPLLPEGILECLLRSTDELQRQGWSLPPGARRVLYTRPQGAVVATQPPRPRPRALREPVECALIALGSHAVNGEVLPQLRLAVPQMEALHRALSYRLDGRVCSEITGRGDDRSPLQEGHRHAHYIPLCIGDRRGAGGRWSDAPIDHVLVYAPQGLGHVAQEALGQLRWIRSALVGEWREVDDDDPREKDRRRLTTTLVATGDVAMIQAALAEARARGRGGVDLFGESTVWESHTPFIPPRFVKPRHPIEAQVQAELASRGLPAAAAIEVLAGEDVAAGFQTFVRRRRSGKPQPPATRPWALRLTFDAPIREKLVALGYGSHFGLGVFRPAPPSR